MDRFWQNIYIALLSSSIFTVSLILLLLSLFLCFFFFFHQMKYVLDVPQTLDPRILKDLQLTLESNSQMTSTISPMPPSVSGPPLRMNTIFEVRGKQWQFLSSFKRTDCILRDLLLFIRFYFIYFITNVHEWGNHRLNLNTH